MNKSESPSVTIEEAIAKMISMDDIPDVLTTEDILEHYIYEAEEAYESAKDNDCSDSEIIALKLRLDSCNALYLFASMLHRSLYHDATNLKNSTLEPVVSPSGLLRLTFESVAMWAENNFGISIRISLPESSEPSVEWKNVIIKIRNNNKIAYSFGDGKYSDVTLDKIGLWDKKEAKPNHQAGILLALSKNRKYPEGDFLKKKEKTAISRLRIALWKLTNLTKNPFAKHNKHDGYKPLFRIIDDRRNAEEREKKKAIHYPIDSLSKRNLEKMVFDPWDDTEEVDDFEREDDNAQKFIDETE